MAQANKMAKTAYVFREKITLPPMPIGDQPARIEAYLAVADGVVVYKAATNIVSVRDMTRALVADGITEVRHEVPEGMSGKVLGRFRKGAFDKAYAQTLQQN